MDELKTIIGAFPEFLESTIRKVVDAGFDLSDFSQLDHLCYRTATIEQYTAIKQQLLPLATLLAETTINNRPIATFRLQQPIISGKWRIDTLEVPAPKSDKQTIEGLEHIEFVLFDDLETFMAKHPQKAFDMKGFKRVVNPHIGYALDNDTSVRFHLLNLPTVVYFEKQFPDA